MLRRAAFLCIPLSLTGVSSYCLNTDTNNYDQHSQLSSVSAKNKLPLKDVTLTVPVITYNVLSSELCEPDHFMKSDPKDLDPPTRLIRVCDKLQTQISQNKPIICLQEISRTWVGPLHVFCEKNGYHFVTSLYGSKFSGYMGVGIAFPADEYEAVDIDISRLSDTVNWPIYKQPAKTKGSERTFDPWNTAKRRYNTIVWTRLRHKKTGKTFCAATYHMPCLFGSPKKRQTMILHTSLLSNYLSRLAQNDPYFLAGDFNFKPWDSSYRLLTTGHLEKSDSDFPQLQNQDGMEQIPEWPISPVQKLTSAYASKKNQEPDFTNKSCTKFSPHFIGTLDYIFFSPGWTCGKCIDLPAAENCKGYLPNGTEPSDHLLIGAELQLSKFPPLLAAL